MEVATPLGFKNNPELVLEFYNQRRRQLLEVYPNFAHKTIKEFEKIYKVSIITQTWMIFTKELAIVLFTPSW